MWVTDLASAVLQDEVDVMIVLKVAVKLDDVCVIKWTMKLYLSHYLHSQSHHIMKIHMHDLNQHVG